MTLRDYFAAEAMKAFLSNNEAMGVFTSKASREGTTIQAAVADMAEKADGQVWLERVGDGDECSVIIEDGQVKE